MKTIKTLHKCTTVNTSAIRQQAAHTTYNLLAAQQEPYKKQNKTKTFSGEKKAGEWTIRRKMTRQKERED